MEFTDVIYEKQDGIATISMNRPERLNAFGGSMLEEMAEAVVDARDDDSMRVIVITGKGRAFSAGGDVGSLGPQSGSSTAFDQRRWLVSTQTFVSLFRSVEKPIIAAVNGAAVGGGCDVALACDIRIASDRARFGEVFAKVGLFPGTGGCYMLPRIVGTAKALELIWSGDIIDAAEAERLGLVTKVVPDERLMEETREFAQRFVNGPPLAMALAKAAVYRGLDMSVHDALSYAATAESITLTSEDHKEGSRAFFEKRAPVFRGR